MEDQAAMLRRLVENRNDAGWRLVPDATADRDEFADSNQTARIIAVTSGKGGVGKTNLTVNLAIALGMAGKRVIVLDADLGMANVDVLLGTASKYNLLHLLQEDVQLEDVLLDGPYGVRYISGGSGIEEAADFSQEERQQLWQKLAYCGAMADIILVDTGAGLGKNVLDFILAADEVLLLTTPEPTALTDAYAVMKAYSRYALRKNMRLVVNRVYEERDSLEVTAKLSNTAERFLQMTIPCLGYIYEDQNMGQAVRRQTPVVVSYPNSIAAKCVRAIAQNLLYGEKITVHRGWRGFLQHFLDFSR